MRAVGRRREPRELWRRRDAPDAATQPIGRCVPEFDENRVKVVAEEPVSTFSIDVDTASYSYVRACSRTAICRADAVRLEELINYFPYDYRGRRQRDVPFKATMAVFPTPWNTEDASCSRSASRAMCRRPSERQAAESDRS